MKKQMLGALVLIALAALILAPFARAYDSPHPHLTEALTLDHTEGKAPLSVRIVTPKELQEAWDDWETKNVQRNKWGDQFYISWGDDSGVGDSAVIGVKPADQPNHTAGYHVYSKPGTYTVRAGLYDISPTDAHRFYWQGQIVVTVH